MLSTNSYIISYSGSLLHKFKKHIANILKAYVKDQNYNAKNSTTFSNYIVYGSIEDDEIMVSFTVTSSYTNIPPIDTLNIIKDHVDNDDDQFTRKATIPQERFLDLSFYNFNFQFYRKTDGVAMGSPASSTTAEIYMQANKIAARSKSLGTIC